MYSSTDVFKQLADETRLRLLHLLLKEHDLCVCELTRALNLTQPKISRHLASLRGAGLIMDTRRGTWIFYRLHPELPAWVRAILDQTFSTVGKTAPFIHDLKRLRPHPDRPLVQCESA